MTRYNHFSTKKYKQIPFVDIPIGGKFRKDFHDIVRKRLDIVCVKTGEMTYKEFRSGKKRQFMHMDSSILVSSHIDKV